MTRLAMETPHELVLAGNGQIRPSTPMTTRRAARIKVQGAARSHHLDQSEHRSVQ